MGMQKLKEFDPDPVVMIELLSNKDGSFSRPAWLAQMSIWKRTPSPEAHERRADDHRGFEEQWQWLSGVHIRQWILTISKVVKAKAKGNIKAVDKYMKLADVTAIKINKFKDDSSVLEA
jgi:hypothetical protein